jgi:hypothetical protein
MSFICLSVFAPPPATPHVARTNTVPANLWLQNIKANSATQVAPVNPRPFLQELTGKMVAVKLKWGLEYRGFLVATDAYMNLQVRSPALSTR